MTVLPGSLDYLYYNGILDHIPYEAYEMTPVMNSSMQQNSVIASQYLNGSDYLNTAMKGQIYGYYGNSYDSFVGSTNYQQINGMQSQMHVHGRGDRRGVNNGKYINSEENDFKKSIHSQIKGSKEVVSGHHYLWKGLLAAAIVIATPILIFKGRKKPPIESTNKSGFWSKLNPKNWFKKNKLD